MGGRRDKVANSKPLARPAPSQAELSDAMLGRGAPIVEVPTLALVTEGQLEFKRFTLTETELIIPDDVTLQEWAEVGRFLLSITTPIQWWLLDWLAVSENRGWGETYRQIADEFGVQVDTLWTYVSAVRSIKSSIRNRGLSLAHHRLVISMPDDDQRYWLQTAAMEGWTVSQMRAAIKGQPPARSSGLIARIQKFFGQKWDKYQYYQKRLDKVGQGDLSQLEQLVITDIEKSRNLLQAIQRQKKG